MYCKLVFLVDLALEHCGPYVRKSFRIATGRLGTFRKSVSLVKKSVHLLAIAVAACSASGVFRPNSARKRAASSQIATVAGMSCTSRARRRARNTFSRIRSLARKGLIRCEISSRCLQVKEIMAQLFIRRPVVDSRMWFDGIIEIDESGQAELAVLS